jgi:hypothetical protein
MSQSRLSTTQRFEQEAVIIASLSAWEGMAMAYSINFQNRSARFALHETRLKISFHMTDIELDKMGC